MNEVEKSPIEQEGFSNPWLKLAALLIGAAVALALLDKHFGSSNTNFEDAATLGAETTTVLSKMDGYSIHCSDRRDAESCISGSRSRKAERSVLWLGNSQLHAINQWRQGETNGTPILYDALKRHGLDLLSFSQPNANLQEHYILFAALQRKLPLRVLILPVVFDDLREEGVRNEVAVFARDKDVATTLSRTEIGNRLASASRVMPQDTDNDTAGIANTLQERAERGIVTWLDQHSQLWQARSEIRGQLFLSLYRLRNTLFDINPTSKRRVIPGPYHDNMAALRAILDLAIQNRILVVLYVAPLRQGVEIPYVAEEYDSFKLKVEKLGDRAGVYFVNLEQLVPEELWGTKATTSLEGDRELDFMHFQFGGHQLLANRLTELVLSSLADTK